ncbi:MAG TPA: hypothetical protein VMY41_09100 [Thermohalobaculum sp.]|nr:hypothetical protein [Thermohalobaculum sp.]
MDQALPTGGVLWRVLGAWADPRGSMRTELDRAPSEGRLLFYIMFAGLFRFVGAAMALAYGPMALMIPDDQFRGRIAAAFVAIFFFLTILSYAVAATGGALARLMGGTGSWYDSRAALFWAALVAAPAVLGAKLLSLVLVGLPALIVGSVEMLGGVAFAWTTAYCFAEAHGFASVWKVFAVIAGLAIAVVGTIYRLGQIV